MNDAEPVWICATYWIVHVVLPLCRIGSVRVGIAARALAVQHHQAAIGQRACGRGIPAGGNEAQHLAARLGDVHHRGGIGVRADHIQTALIAAERQRAGRHAERMIGRRGDVDGFHARADRRYRKRRRNTRYSYLRPTTKMRALKLGCCAPSRHRSSARVARSRQTMSVGCAPTRSVCSSAPLLVW